MLKSFNRNVTKMKWSALWIVISASFVVFGRARGHEMYVGVNDYFPGLHRELSRVTWAHATNSHELLNEALEDKEVMMLEADVLMGHHSIFEGITPIMAHPPHKTSSLSFSEFVDAVIKATKHEEKKKGIKLDFKDIETVEQCLKLLKTKMEEEEIKFPVFINADILRGPVNATKVPLDAEKFITMVAKHTPFAVLSVGWTTRYGNDDPLEEIREGKYTRQHTRAMLKVLKEFAYGPNGRSLFPHITFPVRAGLAAESVEELLDLTFRVRGDSSLTLWSPNTDPVGRRKLHGLLEQQGKRHVFIDLPFNIEEGHEVEEEETSIEQDPSSIQRQVEGRGHGEDGANSGTAIPPKRNALGFGVFLAMGVMCSIVYVFLRP